MAARKKPEEWRVYLEEQVGTEYVAYRTQSTGEIDAITVYVDHFDGGEQDTMWEINVSIPGPSRYDETEFEAAEISTDYIRSIDSVEHADACAEALRMAAALKQNLDEQFQDDVKAAEDRRKAQEAEEAKERAAEDEKWKERLEMIKWEVVGDKVRIRPTGYRSDYVGYIELMREGLDPDVEANWRGRATDKSRGTMLDMTRLRDIAKLEAKRGSRFELIWDDSDPEERFF